MAPPHIFAPAPQMPPLHEDGGVSEDEHLDSSGEDSAGVDLGTGDSSDGSDSSDDPEPSLTDMPMPYSPASVHEQDVLPWLSVEGSMMALDFRTVRIEEHWHIQRSWQERRQQACVDLHEDRAFAVALSGGGVRAAAFQSGVLWRLAEEGLLKDVDFMAAVSGGGYLASAFASHLFAAGAPSGMVGRRQQDEQAVKSWYLRATAKAICRMQANAGGFVRDPQTGRSPAPEGSGQLPRWLDFPVMMLALFSSMLFSPLTFIVLVAVPVIELVENFFGAAMRAGFCAPADGGRKAVWVRWYQVYTQVEQRSHLQCVVTAMLVSALLTFICWATSKWQQCLALPRISHRRKQTRPVASRGLLFADGSRAFLLRFTSILALFILVVYLAALAQWWQYSYNASDDRHSKRLEWCGLYVTCNGKISGSHFSRPHRRCSTAAEGFKPWWSTSEFDPYRNHSLWNCREAPPPDVAPAWELYQDFSDPNSIGSLLWHAFLVALILAVCLWPFISGLLFWLLAIAGQAVAFAMLVLAAQFRVFSPLTGQDFMGTFHITEVGWYYFAGTCLIVAYVLVPVHNNTGSFWHRYYRRTLRLNFLQGGEDQSLAEVQGSPWCPLLLLTATVNDFRSVGDRSKSNTEEISFSALHTGSDKLGYYVTPAWRRLAHVTAITAAACLDTIAISMTKRTRYRFWSDMLNLSWGDYISFVDYPWWYRRLPTLCLYLVYQTLLLVGFQLSRVATSCHFSNSCIVGALIIGSTSLLLSFFTFVRCFRFFALDPLLRRFHQVTRYYYLGGSSAVPHRVRGAPGLVYVTDGGVRDCTGILQLMRRRCRHILLVLAAADPQDELGVLRTAMEVAEYEKIGSFYDLEDEKRNIRILLEEYRYREDWTFLQLGIRYGWRFEGPCHLGRLVVIKNRLPRTKVPDHRLHGYEDRLCKALLTEEVICGDAGPEADALAGDDPMASMKQVELGGFGCCDCCHTHKLNCGGKFPHLGFTGYLWLTPTLFSSLCRLGHAISEDGVAALKAGLCREPARGSGPVERGGPSS